MYYHSAFGITIASDIEMPELLISSAPPDLFFRIGKLKPPLTDQKGAARIILRRGQGILLYWSMIGTFLVENGTTVTVSPVAEVDVRLLRLVMTGPVLGIVLHQRSFMVFHSSVLSFSDQRSAVAFVAQKGAGKSTMAAAMYNLGYSIMSDDILALSENNGVFMAYSGFPHVKLWQDSASALVLDSHLLAKLGPGFDKRGRIIQERFFPYPAELKMVFVLEFGDTLGITQLTGKEALKEILPHWYGALFRGQLLDLFGRDKHFMECAAIVRNIPVYKLTRLQSMDRLQDTVRFADHFIKIQSGID